MIEILREPLETYLLQKASAFKGNALADKFRNLFPDQIRSLIPDQERYLIDGSAGKGQWTDCPWIAVFDILITDSAQRGYYPVYLFKSDMSGVYLSLNQGITEVRLDYKRDAKKVLRLRAEDYRAKLGIENGNFLNEINLKSSKGNSIFYQAGNIIAKYYDASSLPDEDVLKEDLRYFLRLYEELTYTDNSIGDDFEKKNASDFEKKQLRFHRRIERNSNLSKKIKKLKRYKCEVCEMEFKDKYGALGKDFIEVHHLKPISELDLGTFKVNLYEDFAVLCSNCHSMIHRLPDAGNLRHLKQILEVQKLKVSH